MLGEKVGVAELDRLWIFPPLIRGRREWGLVAASVYMGGQDERRRLLSAPYVAERTGQGGLSVVHDLEEQGEAPADRLPRVMDGVVRRGGEEMGEPREVLIEGSAETFEELLKELESA